LLCASLTGLCFAALAPAAEAAEARRRFDIPAKPYSEALIDLAVQADVSLLGASTCDGGQAPALTGRYTLSVALAKVLAGAPCAWRIVDAKTVRISPLPAPAATRPAPPGPPLVTELLVTARKRPERLDTLPAGVSVISGDQLRATGAGDARGAAGQLVGVLMTNLGPGRDKLLMRGLSDGAFTGRARSTVSTYLDDAPINYNAPDPDLRLTDVEQIETVRGPQGALYGSGALAGVYRIVTNKPDPERFRAGGEVIGASTKGGSPSYEAEAYVNIPLDGGAALRLVAYDDHKGGYLDNVALRLSNVDSTARQGGRAALRFAFGDNWTLDLAAAAQRLSSRDTQYTTRIASKTLRTNQVREASDNNFTQGAVTLHGELGWADLTSSTSYVQHAYSSLYDATAVATSFSETGAALGIYSESARIRRAVQDLVLTSSGAGQLSWLVGLYGSMSTERTPSSLDILVGPALSTAAAIKAALVRVYDEDRRDHQNELAAYGEATWRFAPGWTAAAGGRVSQTDLKVKSKISGAPPTHARDVAVNRAFSGVTSKLSVQYELTGGALLYGLYSDGFRPGGVNTTNFIGINPTRTAFEPDRLRNLEVGAKGRFLERRLTLRAAGFYDVWANLQSDQYRSSGVAYTANVGDAHIQGLEAEAAYEWDFGLTLQANGLYSNAKITRINPDFFRNNPALARRLGSGLPGAPKVSGGLLVRYERPLRGDLSLRLVGEANYVGPARLTFDPTLSDRTDAVVDAEVLAELTTPRWSAGIFVTNPADSSNNTFAYGNPFTFGKVRQVTPQRPRTVGVRLAASF
jgi:iron complex outermembrane receptor protein